MAFSDSTTRRSVLKAGAAFGGLLIVSCSAESDVSDGKRLLSPKELQKRYDVNAYIRLTKKGRAYFFLPGTEMGQGISTSLAMILAEELDYPMDAVSMEQAPSNIEVYGMQSTGGSMSIRSNFDKLREVAAAARAMLVAEAAERWGDHPAACRTEAGAVYSADGRKRFAFGDLVENASGRQPPEKPQLKRKSDYKVIGVPQSRIDAKERISGKAIYGIDVSLPGMKYAALAFPPHIGGSVKSYDDKPARALAGVVDVIGLPEAVAVIADDTWTAMQARDALLVEWTEPDNKALNLKTIYDDLEAGLNEPGSVAVATEGHEASMQKAADKFAAVYRQPFLAHAALEPMNCIAHVQEKACEIWSGTQVVGDAQLATAEMLGLPAEAVTIHNYPMGGGFGRRLEIDGILTATAIARQVPYPVKMTWSRQDDIHRDYFRPAYADRIEAALNEDGRPVAWTHRIAGSSILARLMGPEFKGVDFDAVECAVEPLYKLDDHRVEFRRVETGSVRTSWWRGVGPLRSTFVLESFIDELAYKAGVDPLTYRRELLSDPRMIALLDRVAEMAGWGEPLEKGRGRGIALQHAFGSYGAMIMDVSLSEDAGLSVNKIFCAVDCGLIINPRGVEAQVQGGALFGLSAALGEGVDIEQAEIVQGNYDTYNVLRMPEAPEVSVSTIEGDEAPGGLGELGTTLSAPALVNAIYAASSLRLRKLPVREALAGLRARGE